MALVWLAVLAAGVKRVGLGADKVLEVAQLLPILDLKKTGSACTTPPPRLLASPTPRSCPPTPFPTPAPPCVPAAVCLLPPPKALLA